MPDANWRCLIISSLLLFASSVRGQALAESIQDLHTSETTEFSSHAVTVLAQDSDGVVWVGTQRGLYIFDRRDSGTNRPIEVRGLERTWIRSIYLTGNSSTAYIGTNRGIFRYSAIYDELSTPRVFRFTERIAHIEEVNGELFIATTTGLYVSDLDLLQVPKLVPDSRGVTIAVMAGDRSTQWVGTFEGLYKLTSSELTKLNDETLGSSRITAIAKLPEGILVGTRKKGIYHIDEANGKIISHNSLNGFQVYDILIDESQNIWIATRQALLVIQSANTQFSLSEDETDIQTYSQNGVSSLMEDDAGNIWIGSDTGITRISSSKTNFPLIDFENSGLKHDAIITFYEMPNGSLLVSTLKGVALRNKKAAKFTDLGLQEFGDDTLVTAISEHNGKLYFGTMRQGLSAHAADDMELSDLYSTKTNIDSRKTPSDTITTLLHLNETDLLVTTYANGVFIIRSDGSVDVQSLPLRTLNQEMIASGDIDEFDITWLVTRSCRVWRYDHLSRKLKSFELEELAPLSNDPTCSDIKATKSAIWIGTARDGLVKLDPKTATATIYAVQDGLADNLIYTVEVDNNSNVWLSTSNGLSYIDAENDEIRTFTTSHGLQGNDFNESASLKLSDGTLLFGGNNGFNAIDPTNIKLNTYKGNTLVTSFSKMNERQPGRFLSDGSEIISLTHDENVFSFGYALMDFASPEDNTYEYQLVGFDADWIDAGKRSTATYTNLDAGAYTFQVRGRNNDGLLTDKIGTVHLQIAPPPWLTWWAYTLYWVLAALLIFFGLRLYARNVARRIHEKRNEEEKQRLELLVAERTQELSNKTKELLRTLHQKELANKEIHHRVKNNLQVILGLLTLQAESEESELLQDAMNQIRQRITSMSLIHKSLYENNVASIDFKQYTENLVASIRQFHPDLASGNIEVLLDVESEVLDIDTALPVGLILNELITNAIKHGFDLADDSLKMIKIVFNKRGNNYHLEVSDNGRGLPEGFDINSPTSMGSELSLIFSQQLQGSLVAATATEGGASFLLTFPAIEKQAPAEEIEEL